MQGLRHLSRMSARIVAASGSPRRKCVADAPPARHFPHVCSAASHHPSASLHQNASRACVAADPFDSLQSPA
jgi:hypothetical protein